MNKQVIYKFNDEAHLNACLEWWQMRLGLRDWIIKAKLTNDLNDDDNHGENEYQPSNKCAMIRIRPFDSLCADGWITKQPQELVLVHELLHCKIFQITYDTPSIEMILFNQAQHQLIEDMAKALIMAKYGLTLEWFKV